MNPASISLWLNVATNGFANGPSDASPFLPPLNTVENSAYAVDVYFVAPSGSYGSPWIYNDPTSYIAAATLAFGNQFSFALYAKATTYSVLTDQYGPKARFALTLSAAQLTTDLANQASVIGLLQLAWTTSFSSPIAQLQTVISKVLPTP